MTHPPYQELSRSIKGKTALVTGASRGLGVHLARALAARGMKLAIAARSADALEHVKAELGSYGVAVQCIPIDISDRQALPALVDQVIDELGSIDVLVNNAGLDQCAVYSEFSPDDIAQVIDVNLTAPILLTRLVLPHMLARATGHVVNIASVAGLVGVAYNETYAATKHALVGFTRSLAATAEGEGWPIGFSCILPGFIADAGMYKAMQHHTGENAPILSGTSSPQKVAEEMVKAIEHDRLEVVVSTRPFRLLAVLLLWFPSATKWALRVTGSIGWFQAVARAKRQSPQDR